MKRKAKASLKKTLQLLTFAFVAFLLLDLFGLSRIAELNSGESWEQKTIEFRAIRYVEEEDVTDRLPAAIAWAVEFLSWDDGEEEGYYQMTDGNGQVWVIYPGQVDAEDFRETVREGDSVTIWWELAENRDNVVRAIEGYYDYEEAAADREDAVRRIGAVLPFTAAVTALAGYWLLRLKREGEAFLKKLPKWIVESE